MKKFVSNSYPTIGVEEEFQLIDNATWRLSLDKTVDDVKELLDKEMQERVCYELFDSVIENRSGVCRDVDSIIEQVKHGRLALQKACETLNLALVASGAYPFDDWRKQQFVDTPHYQWLRENYYFLAKRLMAFGLHVHVGVKSLEAAFYVMNEMKRWVYPLLALSANSPCYDNFDTGLDSTRTHLFHSMPRTQFAPDFETLEDLENYYSRMLEAGDIQRPGDLWWMMRPPLPLGTVEYRVCDLSTDVNIIGAIVAVFQAATAYYQDLFFAGAPKTVFADEYLEQNCWRCSKDSLNAKVVDPVTKDVLTVKEQLAYFFSLLEAKADELGCIHYLEFAKTLLEQENEATWQKKRLRELNGDFEALTKELAQRSCSF